MPYGQPAERRGHGGHRGLGALRKFPRLVFGLRQAGGELARIQPERDNQ